MRRPDPHGDDSPPVTLIYTDGASRGNPGRAGIGVVLRSDGALLGTIKAYIGIRTNNQAEYEALIAALKKARELGSRRLHIFTDSQLLANQVNGLWKIKDPTLRGLYEKARSLMRDFDSVTVTHVRRDLNKEADRLANEAIDDYIDRVGE